ncbi:pilus assembly protein N-terminal domain-containing protein [Salinarimonas ramus]|uniref:Pilus formation protein N-terminal domain-containing protein n=1 Tax=Salinarimonas ramus TaxID=690164 RepID=A0A917Q733_9HYPH|nr:hypothetical protein GCM10011322_19400 [Salinarimonas ramus]
MRIRPGRVAAPIIAVTAALGFAFAPAPELRSQEDGAAPRVVTQEPSARVPSQAPMPDPTPEPAVGIAAPSPRIVAVNSPAPGGPVVDPAAVADEPMPVAPGAPAAGGEALTVFLDHAKVIRLPERTQTVIVGNPFIADVTVQRNGILIVTGKSYGATNLIALDGQGLLLAESMVSVQAPDSDGVVVVQRGLARESYACTPNCQPSLRLGDSPEYFGAVGSQATQRSGFAVSN